MSTKPAKPDDGAPGVAPTALPAPAGDAAFPLSLRRVAVDTYRENVA